MHVHLAFALILIQSSRQSRHAAAFMRFAGYKSALWRSSRTAGLSDGNWRIMAFGVCLWTELRRFAGCAVGLPFERICAAWTSIDKFSTGAQEIEKELRKRKKNCWIFATVSHALRLLQSWAIDGIGETGEWASFWNGEVFGAAGSTFDAAFACSAIFSM